jgi:Tol biopolymer transport system component
MKTDNDLERRLRDVLREELDREHGPDPAWDESPAARRVTEQHPRRPSRWTVRLLAVAALITIGVGSALLLGAPDDVPALGPNGWIAYGMNPEAGGDQDIWFVGLDSEPRRVIGSDEDSVDQFCPAFSPDGRSLAYGEADHTGATPKTAVVIAAVNNEGDVSEEFRVDVGEVPPCPVWSPDGERIAFGVPLTSVINPTQSAAGSEVWILTLADRGITVVPDLLATDLEFSPDGSVLGIASGVEYDGNFGEALGDNRIHLYDLASGGMRILEGTRSVSGSFTWSPDGERIAYQGRELRVIDLDTEDERVLSAPYGTLHGIGPVWSPDGESVVYQRCRGFVTTQGFSCESERHDVVLVWPDDLSADGTPREEVVPLSERSANGSETAMTPYWVSWSPDSEYLLFAAWSNEIDPLLGVVPVASASPSDVLVSAQDVAVYPVYEFGPFVPIQSWGRLPADAAMPTPNPEVSTVGPTPSPSPWVGLPAGPHLLSEGTDDGVPITVTVAAPLWNGEPNGGSLCWGGPADTCADPSGGVGLLAFEGREYSVYGEACTWASTGPDTPATTVDELIHALANQGSRNESGLEDITVDGYAGKRIVLGMHPVDIDACDEGHVALFGLPGTDPARFTQDQDLIEEVWAVDVDGLIVVLDATYSAATPQNAIDEVRAIVQSATFD